MGTNTWKIIGAIEVAALACLTIWSAVSGGCSTPVELAGGGSAPMKCFWTFRAAAAVGAVGTVSALLALISKTKEGRRFCTIGAIAAAIVAMLLPTPGVIGLCAMPEMHCHTTALGVWIVGAIAIVVGIVLAAKADPTAASKPKRGV